MKSILSLFALAIITFGCSRTTPITTEQTPGRYQLHENTAGAILLDTANGRMWIFRPTTENAWGGIWVQMPDVAGRARQANTNSPPALP